MYVEVYTFPRQFSAHISECSSYNCITWGQGSLVPGPHPKAGWGLRMRI